MVSTSTNLVLRKDNKTELYLNAGLVNFVLMDYFISALKIV